jgi:hypothetical protein
VWFSVGQSMWSTADLSVSNGEFGMYGSLFWASVQVY